MRHLLLSALVGALLAGCGGSDSGSDDASDEFVRQVDALCEQANPQLAEINAALMRARDAARAGQVSPRETFETFATLLRRADTTTQGFEDRLRKISPPEEEREFHANLLDSIEQGRANLRQQIGAAEREDAVALRDLSQQGSQLNARTKGLVTGHGDFRFCGRA